MASDDYPAYYDAVMEAHAAGAAVLQRANLSVEPAHIALTVEDYRWAWRPEHVRVLLIAESHVYTTAADAEIEVRPVPLPIDVAAISPSSFVRLVYCLGYGESQLLSSEP